VRILLGPLGSEGLICPQNKCIYNSHVEKKNGKLEIERPKA